MKLRPLLMALVVFAGGPAVPAAAALWTAAVEVGLVSVFAEMNDATDPVLVMIRVENHSKLASVPVSRYFVQVVDARKQPMRAITADDLVSDQLQKLRDLMPQNINEIDALVGEIQADYPQEKLITVYGRLKQFVAQGRPTGWRTSVENFLLARHYSTEKELQDANRVIEEVGDIARNYLWPRDVAPESVYTGTVYFERPMVKDPPSIFFELEDKKLIGTQFTLSATRKPGR
jgi:hypothetical protein